MLASIRVLRGKVTLRQLVLRHFASTRNRYQPAAAASGWLGRQARLLAFGLWHSILIVMLCYPAMSAGATRDPLHGIAMHGLPELADGFAHFPYVNANAPKGGTLRLGVLGTFDNLNPFIIRGLSPEGLRSYVFESLLARSADEPFSLYGLIAWKIEVGSERDSITFHLRPEARFSDGVAITSADVAFSHRLLKAKGWPYMRSHYSKVDRIDVINQHTVRFHFAAKGDRELALIMGLMPILPRHAFSQDTFEQTTLKPVIGSGPYTIGVVSPGRRISFVRNVDYWGWGLPANRGRHNFDAIQVEFFRDDAGLFEAFKSGSIDVRVEEDPARWAERYDFPAVRRGNVVLKEAVTTWPAGMLALVFNTRREQFKDRRVRRALAELFPFSEINRLYYNGLYRRSQSFFARSALASTGRAASKYERQILAQHPGVVPASIMAGHGAPSGHDGYMPLRPRLEAAYRLLREAGYEVRGHRLVNVKSGQALGFEFLAASKAQERLMLAFARTLERLGIVVRIRQVDASQYGARLKSFDYDMIQWRWPASLSPGNEQIPRWSSQFADTEGSLNYPGVKEPAVDAAIAAMLSATDRVSFEDAVRALDRVLLAGDYVIPLFHAESQWIAHWRHLRSPAVTPMAGVGFDTWWNEPISGRSGR